MTTAVGMSQLSCFFCPELEGSVTGGRESGISGKGGSGVAGGEEAESLARAVREWPEAEGAALPAGGLQARPQRAGAASLFVIPPHYPVRGLYGNPSGAWFRK